MSASAERLLVNLFHAAAKRSTAPRETASCSCGQPRRPGQRNCNECHATKQRAYRAKQRDANSPFARFVRRS